MFTGGVAGGDDWLVASSLDIEYGDVALSIARCYKIRVALAELAASQTVRSVEYLLREARVLQCPERKDTLLL